MHMIEEVFSKGRYTMAEADKLSCESLIADWLTVEGDLDDFIFYSEPLLIL